MDFDLFELHFSRTLWEGVYRAWVLDAEGMQVASLRVITCLPLDRSELPESAPEAAPVLLVTVDIAEIDPQEFMEWENSLALKILAKFSHQEPLPRECQFFYPSPMNAHWLEDKNTPE